MYELRINRVRQVSKAIIREQDNPENICVVEGSRGLMNIPGGGLEYVDNSSMLNCLFRELSEELGEVTFGLRNVEDAFRLTGDITNRKGRVFRNNWYCYTALYKGSFDELISSRPLEITKIHSMTAEQIFRDPLVRGMAKQAVYYSIYGELNPDLMENRQSIVINKSN